MSVRRLYKMNYVCVCWAPIGVSRSLGLVETIMAVMVRIEAAVMSPIIGRGMMNVLITAVVRAGQAIVSMSVPIAAISSISMTIMSISKAVDATFFRLLLTHARLQLGVRSGSRLSYGCRQTVCQTHGEGDEKALQNKYKIIQILKLYIYYNT